MQKKQTSEAILCHIEFANHQGEEHTHGEHLLDTWYPDQSKSVKVECQQKGVRNRTKRVSCGNYVQLILEFLTALLRSYKMIQNNCGKLKSQTIS